MTSSRDRVFKINLGTFGRMRCEQEKWARRVGVTEAAPLMDQPAPNVR